MTLDQMRLITSVADAGSLNAAAKNLRRSPPALSIAIKKLEAELGLAIVSRENYRIALTEVGEALCVKARQVLRLAKEVDLLGEHLALGQENEIRIGILSVVPSRLLLDALRQCEAEFPQTTISLRAGSLFGPMEDLLAGDADIATVLWLEPRPELESIPLFRPTIVPVASPTFLPGNRRNKIKLDMLRGYRQVILRSSGRHVGQDSRFYGRIEESSYWEVYDDLTKKEVILAGLGWARMPVHMIEDELENGSLVKLDIEDIPSQTELDIRVARLARNPVGPVSSRLWDHLRDSGKDRFEK